MSSIPMNSVSEEFPGACILRATVSTTGYCGGDTGHGGRTQIVFEDLGGTDIEASFNESVTGKTLTISLGGDEELRLIIDAMRFAADSLERLAGKQR